MAEIIQIDEIIEYEKIFLFVNKVIDNVIKTIVELNKKVIGLFLIKFKLSYIEPLLILSTITVNNNDMSISIIVGLSM